jgi:transcriptional regulator with XRE-family HTH domain
MRINNANTARRREVAGAFGAVLRNSRRLHNVSQETLAELADLDRIYLSPLERGLRQPTLTYLFAITDALGVNPEELVRLTRGRVQLEPTDAA